MDVVHLVEKYGADQVAARWISFPDGAGTSNRPPMVKRYFAHVPPGLLSDYLQVYAFLITFGKPLNIFPMTFDDFCASLTDMDPSQNTALAEVFAGLLAASKKESAQLEKDWRAGKCESATFPGWDELPDLKSVLQPHHNILHAWRSFPWGLSHARVSNSNAMSSAQGRLHGWPFAVLGALHELVQYVSDPLESSIPSYPEIFAKLAGLVDVSSDDAKEEGAEFETPRDFLWKSLVDERMASLIVSDSEKSEDESPSDKSSGEVSVKSVKSEPAAESRGKESTHDFSASEESVESSPESVKPAKKANVRNVQDSESSDEEIEESSPESVKPVKPVKQVPAKQRKVQDSESSDEEMESSPEPEDPDDSDVEIESSDEEEDELESDESSDEAPRKRGKRKAGSDSEDSAFSGRLRNRKPVKKRCVEEVNRRAALGLRTGASKESSPEVKQTVRARQPRPAKARVLDTLERYVANQSGVKIDQAVAKGWTILTREERLQVLKFFIHQVIFDGEIIGDYMDEQEEKMLELRKTKLELRKKLRDW